ncbi:uncharacterized protein ACR2FA_006220 [Aphomia sociella]
MKLVQCCWVAALLMSVSVAIDVEKTVRQVQNILQANTQLPRLSREEILELLNNIRAEDSKSISSTEQSQEIKTLSTQVPNIDDNVILNDKEFKTSTKLPQTTEAPIISTQITTTTNKSTTKKGEPTLMVVLPYTPRDGSSLQELYTRPPRIEVVPISKTTPSPNTLSSLAEKMQENYKISQLSKEKKQDFPEELQAFLDAHGLKGTPGSDHFLLPLEGFKPLPPAKVVDGSVQLPENILLNYDLISSNSDHIPMIADDSKYPLTPNYLLDPLRSDFPFELDTSSSESQKIVLPLDLPKTKSGQNNPNYDPISYDSVKVIPLQQGVSPVENVYDKINISNEPNKRQANESNNTLNTENTTPSTKINLNDTSFSTESIDSAAAADSGASIADLEDSFGGAAPEKPGDSEIPPPRKNGFYWMLDWNSFLEVGDGDTKVNVRFEPKLGDPQMFIPVSVP